MHESRDRGRQMITRISSRASRGKLVALSLSVGLAAAAAVLAVSALAGGSTMPTQYAPTGTHIVQPQSPASIAGLLNGAPASASSSAVTELASLSGGGSVGNVLLSQAKVLLSNNLAWGGTIYAAPSSNGEACYAIDGGPASCVAAFTQATPVAFAKFDIDGPGGIPVTIAGLAPDDVTGIDVEAGPETYHAALANNAFFFEMPSGVNAPISGLTIHYADGTSLQQPLAPLKSETG